MPRLREELGGNIIVKTIGYSEGKRGVFKILIFMQIRSAIARDSHTDFHNYHASNMYIQQLDCLEA
jgi:uncharacterized membrane protein